MKEASREDELVEPIYTALTSLNSGKKFIFQGTQRGRGDPSISENTEELKGNCNIMFTFNVQYL